MSKLRWYILLGIGLVFTSALLYLLQIFFFQKIDDTFFYMLQDTAFVPIQVLLVMLIIDRLLRKKERESLLNKLNMMIGVFFNEVGTGIIERFIEADKNKDIITKKMSVDTRWGDRNFASCRKFLAGFEPELEISPSLLGDMKVYLLERRDHLLRMLENPNLLEHDRFTDLLWAVFHLADELHHRRSFEKLPESDTQHLKGDISRAYRLIVSEWLQYMRHLKQSYPYLFSIAVRTNPFNPDAKITVMK